MSQFKRRYLGELPQQMDTSLGIIDRLDAQLRLNIDNQTRLGERREAFAKRATSTRVVPDDRSGSTGGRLALPPESPGETLARFQQELRQLRVRYTDKHPDVVRVMLAIADLEKELSNSPSPATNTTRDPRSIPLATTNPYLIQLRQYLVYGLLAASPPFPPSLFSIRLRLR